MAPAPPWAVRDGGMRRSQLVAWRTLVTVEADSAVSVDTLRGSFEGAWGAVLDSGAARIAGVVGDYRAGHGQDSLAVPDGLAVPFAFGAVRTRAGLAFTSPNPAACDAPAGAALLPLLDSWTAIPDTLRPGQEWGDSTTYTLCRDGVSLTVATHRRFVVGEARVREGRVVVRVVRHSRTAVVGQGTQFGDSVTVHGAGEGRAELELALRGGIVAAGEGVAFLALEFRGSRRHQRVTQETQLTVREP